MRISDWSSDVCSSDLIALRTSAPSEVPPGSSGLGTGDPNPGRRADGDGTDHGEDELPGLRRHGVLRDTVNGMIDRDGRWCCADKSDGKAEQHGSASRRDGGWREG